ncbi:unnamed protein product [Brugia pahangi]|uniref:Uncharacterized protein n=1 Tax=Brugia pahangi TaxID=6280 RepID=A0A0N4T5S3_BRUPA|nr:unnamed protein product [Brugia pahangi]
MYGNTVRTVHGIQVKFEISVQSECFPIAWVLFRIDLPEIRNSGGINDQIIQKVNLSCSKGHLQWIDPIGGMQMKIDIN